VAFGAGNFVIDNGLKVANFIGFKNIAALSVTAAGAIGGNEALALAGAGAFVGGRSTIGTIVGAGAGFAIGSMIQAQELAEETAEAVSEALDGVSESVSESAENATSPDCDLTSRFGEQDEVDIDRLIANLTSTENAPIVGGAEYGS
jgi:hypothetical protein